LKVAYVTGDDLLEKFKSNLAFLDRTPPHLDSANTHLSLPNINTQLDKSSVVFANAYLGAIAIVQGLNDGVDIIICERVSDASPVIAAAQYWHSWTATDYDRLAGALVAGHLIECSAYATGGNFSRFTDYDIENFMDPGFPLAEINADGTCVITKHPGTGGFVIPDTIYCQFLYELQGNIYLNSDVKAYLDRVSIRSDGENR
jgi:hypothetical protein